MAPPSDAGNGAEYGVLQSRNIDTVVFGDQQFHTWYGNSAYFQNLGDTCLGIEGNQAASRRKTILHVHSGFWIDRLLVCEFCFKYTSNAESMRVHRSMCGMATAFPLVGKLVYVDMKTPYIIKKVRGFQHPLYCQNLSLFGKLFLDDKSVFYNIHAFDYYIIFGHKGSASGSSIDTSEHFRPMGFFSKEVNSWDSDNNLACICVFPPYQRLQLGNLLIEFSYKLALVTPSQTLLGPEFPLSPYGRIVYLRFWSRRLAFTIYNDFLDGGEASCTLMDLALATGFRKEDILMALEYMSVLACAPDSNRIVLSKQLLLDWCQRNKVDPKVLSSPFNPDCALI